MTGFMARAGLSGLALALAVVIAVTWVVMDRWQARVLGSVQPIPAPAEAVADPAAPAPLPEDPGLPFVIDYRAFLERPLFMSTRRPPVVETADAGASEAEPEPEEPLPELSDLRLTSVIITPEERQAWFMVRDSDEFVRLLQGGTLREWTLDQVEESHVVFRARDAEQRLDLRPLGWGVDLAPGERAAPRARE
jgi:hypothetical protein